MRWWWKAWIDAVANFVVVIGWTQVCLRPCMKWCLAREINLRYPKGGSGGNSVGVALVEFDAEFEI